MSRTLMSGDVLISSSTGTPTFKVQSTTVVDGRIKVYDYATHQDRYELVATLNLARVDGSLRLDRDAEIRVTPAAQNDSKLDDRIKQANTFLTFVLELRKTKHVTFNAAYKLAGKSARTLPSRATLYRLLNSKESDRPFYRGDKNKGNRVPRYTEAVDQLICEFANSNYLVRDSRWTLKDLTESINDTALVHGLLPTRSKVSQAYVRRVILECLSADPDIDRMDPKLVAAAKSIARNRIRIARPLMRVEQDALHLPFAVRTPQGVSTNVWLVHAIDCSSGLAAGWHLVVGNPTETDGLACVASILFPKADKLRQLGVNCDFDFYGTPELLVFDNGAEARGERMEQLVRIEIDVVNCRARHPNHKPFIERLNRSLKEALQTLPGSTRKDWRDGARDPIALGDELMDLHQLEVWIVRWYYEKWARQELGRHLRSDFSGRERFGRTPAQRWLRMLEMGYALPMSPRDIDWKMALYWHKSLTLSRKTGITFQTHSYRGDNLSFLIDKYGESEVMVLIDPDDYRQVYVVDGEDLIPLIEEFVEPDTPGHSFAYMAEVRKEWRKEKANDPVATQFGRDVREASKQEGGKRSGKAKPGRTAQNQSTVAAVKQERAKQRAMATPPGALPPGVTIGGSTSSADRTAGAVQGMPKLSGPIAALPVVDRTTGEVVQ